MKSLTVYTAYLFDDKKDPVRKFSFEPSGAHALRSVKAYAEVSNNCNQVVVKPVESSPEKRTTAPLSLVA